MNARGDPVRAGAGVSVDCLLGGNELLHLDPQLQPAVMSSVLFTPVCSVLFVMCGSQPAGCMPLALSFEENLC